MSIITILLLLLGVLVFIIALSGGLIWYFLRVYKYKFVIYANAEGPRPQIERIVRGRLLGIRDSVGQKVFYLPKIKDFVSTNGEKMGKNTFWYRRGPDGMLYNFVMDAKMNVRFIDEDVRAFHTSNNKNIQERYNKPKNWPVILMSFTIVVSLLIVFVGGWMIIKKSGDIITENGQAIALSKETQEATAKTIVGLNNIIDRLDGILGSLNLTAGGTGISPVT